MIEALMNSVAGAIRQEKRVEQVAQNVADYTAVNLESAPEKQPVYSAQSGSPMLDNPPINLDQEMITMLDASNLYKANLAVTKTAKEMSEELLDVLS